MSGEYAETSFFRKYLQGWSFRSSTPAYDEGDEIEVFLTGVRGGTPVARIGDTLIEVPDAPPQMVDSRVAVRVTEFDPEHNRGTAKFVEKVGESAF